MYQAAANGIIVGAAYALVALSFALIYRVTRFFNFAHGATYAVGAYLAFAMVHFFGLPIWAAVASGVGGAAILGAAIQLLIYRRPMKRRASSLVLLLASLGLYIVIQNIISLVFGDDVKSLGIACFEGINIVGIRITAVQLAIMGSSLMSFVMVSALLRYTKFGKAYRATASDPELALVRGVDTNRLVVGVFAIGSGLAGLAGILTALDVNMTPTMGLSALMTGVIAMIVGGESSLLGIVLGALMLGLAQNLGIWKIGSEWQDSIAFTLLVVFVLLRPQGVMGKLSHKSRV